MPFRKGSQKASQPAGDQAVHEDDVIHPGSIADYHGRMEIETTRVHELMQTDLKIGANMVEVQLCLERALHISYMLAGLICMEMPALPIARTPAVPIGAAAAITQIATGRNRKALDGGTRGDMSPADMNSLLMTNVVGFRKRTEPPTPPPFASPPTDKLAG